MDEVKDNASREENKINLFVFYPEAQLILDGVKDNASREENKINLFVFYPEAQLIMDEVKDSQQISREDTFYSDFPF